MWGCRKPCGRPLPRLSTCRRYSPALNKLVDSVKRRPIAWLAAFSLASFLLTSCVLSGLDNRTQPLLNPESGGEYLQQHGAHPRSLAATPVSAQYVVVLCDRGQFSNRMYCLRRGLHVARALNRTLVLPVLTDGPAPVDISRFFDLECFSEKHQAITWERFQHDVCLSNGLQPAPVGSGSFCSQSYTLHVPHIYSLTDRGRSTSCSSRAAGLAQAAQLGLEAHGCKAVCPDNGKRCKPCLYHLPRFLEHFKHVRQQVLVMADLFGVALFENEADTVNTMPTASALCTFMPAPRFQAAAAWLTANLLAPDAAHNSSVSIQPVGEEVPLEGGEEGRGRYLAVHLRRGDWFYYCSGAKNCFYSLAEMAACLEAQQKRHGVSPMYVATNADAREREMLREVAGGQLFFWEDVVAALAAAGEQGPKGINMSDPQDAAMLEKMLCTHATGFVATPHSTFSSQIIEYRHRGYGMLEVDVLRKFFESVEPTYNREQYATCHHEPPVQDTRYFLEPFNLKLALHNVLHPSRGASLQAPGVHPEVLRPVPIPLWLRPFYALERFADSMHDLDIMAAANRFVAMYASPVYATLDLTEVPVRQVASHVACMREVMQDAGIKVVFVALRGHRSDTQRWMLDVVRANGGARHVLSLQGESQEKHMEWVKMYEQDGISRHAEPATIASLTWSLPHAELLVAAKAAILLGPPDSNFYREAAEYRAAFGFSSIWDGPSCR